MTFLSHKQEPYFPGSFSINLKKRKGIKRKKLFFNDWRNTMLIFKNLVCDCAKVVFRHLGVITQISRNWNMFRVNVRKINCSFVKNHCFHLLFLWFGEEHDGLLVEVDLLPAGGPGLHPPLHHQVADLLLAVLLVEVSLKIRKFFCKICKVVIAKSARI